MGLVSANQFNLTPDIVGSASRGLNVGEQFRAQQLQQKQQEFLERGAAQQPGAVQAAGKLGLDFQQQIAESLGVIDKRTKQVDQVKLVEAADFSFKVQDMPLEQQNIAINERIEFLEGQGRDATQTRELLQVPFEQRGRALQSVQLAALPNDERLKFIQDAQTGGRTKFQFGGQESFKDDAGNIFFATTRRNPATGAVESQITPMVEGTQVSGQLTPISSSGITSPEKVSEAGKIQELKLRATRVSDITKELSTRNRDSARSQVKLSQALTLAQQASQGLKGVAKLKLARILPGIDVSNEAALESTLRELALDQLQKFKGPTTDFEFSVTESIVGNIGDSKTANIARLNSLKRSEWFNRQEFKQFKKFRAIAGNDPDEFAFDFQETITTNKGEVTLQDLQDTAVENNMTIEQVIREFNK